MVSRSRGVTLIEVIVVVAIVMIAFLFLLMMMPRGREQARLLVLPKKPGADWQSPGDLPIARASASVDRRCCRHR